MEPSPSQFQKSGRSLAPLFTPFVLKGVPLRNRIVMAPMTRNFSPDGVPGVDVAAYYARRAQDGLGLIITEGTVIDHPAAGGMPRTPHIYGDAAIAGWRHVVDAVHAAGGRIMCQLWHLGASLDPARTGSNVAPVSPSGLRTPDLKVGEPMTQADIDACVSAYARGAQAAKQAGFDGAELHGAHGYLIDQFFWSGTNRRTDRYGGNLAARVRFAVEAVQECRRLSGPDFPILFRFSQWKVQDYTSRVVASPQELAQLVEPLVAAGVDAFDCSTRRFWEPAFDGSDMNLAGWTKKLTGKPVITIGSVTLPMDFVAMAFGTPSDGNPGTDRLMEMFDRGDFDLVAVGRAILADPNWVSKVHGGRMDDLRPYARGIEQTLF